MHRPRALAAMVCCAYFAGCATVDQKLGDQEWYQKSKVVSAKAVEVTTTTASRISSPIRWPLRQ